ncbi:type II secretion system minor pseudopilin GspK [Sandarakinorhabdus sp.]|uniref:type II secretion system minor pseudopilin GspK n=1 Tax=Sandarakinorhabdus sp. TaxID=1916663 RepID=UPI0033427A92
MKRSVPKHEQGAALINVLVLVGVLATLSTSLFDRLRLARALEANRDGRALQEAAVLAAETVAIASVSPAVPLPQAGLQIAAPGTGPGARAAVTPGGNCFNLNSVALGAPGRSVTRPLGVEQLARLLTALDVPSEEAARIAAATADWIDIDQQPGPGGAEDPAYARAATPYRTASTLLAEVSEWRAVAGVTPAIYARARPFVCALPEAELSRPNLNSMRPADAPVLAAIIGAPLATVRDAIAARPAAGWASLADFWAQPLLAGRAVAADALRQPDLRNRWLALTVTGLDPLQPIAATGLIDAGRAPARLVVRRWGPDE